jgi:hypothetical protein
MDMCVDLSDFSHVCDIIHGTPENLGLSESIHNITEMELLMEDRSATQRVANCLAEEAEAEWQANFAILEANQKSWVP